MEGSADAGEVTTRRRRTWGLACLVALAVGAAAAIVGYEHLQRVYEAERRCPPVSGVVMDRDTGLPVPGAFVSRQMMGANQNPSSGLGGSSGPEPLLRFAERTTDEQGRFSFPADKTVLAGGFWEHLLGPDTREGIRLVVYARDYLPACSEALGFGWTKEEWKAIDWSKGPDTWRVVGPLDFSATRQGSLETSYAYRIALIKAVTQAQWEEKCHETWLLNSLYIPKSISDEWLFNDLTGYLERWPDGEKAGEYYKQAWETANLSPCNPYEQDDFARGAISKEQMRIYCDRAAKIINLAESFTKPPPGISEQWLREELADYRKQLSCGEALLQKRGKVEKGGKP